MHALVDHEGPCDQLAPPQEKSDKFPLAIPFHRVAIGPFKFSISNLDLVLKKQAPAIKISESPSSTSKVAMIDDDKLRDIL